MKMIKSIIRPNKVDEVKDALAKLNIAGMTVTEVRGHGKQKGHTAIYRGKEYNVSLLPKMEIEVVVPDTLADDAIKAIVRPNMVDNIKEALGKMNIAGMTVTEVRGHGRQKGHTAVYRGREYEVSLLPKMEIEVVVPDGLADDAIKAIIGAARTGEIGDGRVFVIPVDASYKIRTGEKES